jgi:hypothetical protein
MPRGRIVCEQRGASRCSAERVVPGSSGLPPLKKPRPPAPRAQARADSGTAEAAATARTRAAGCCAARGCCDSGSGAEHAAAAGSLAHACGAHDAPARDATRATCIRQLPLRARVAADERRRRQGCLKTRQP